MKTRLHYITKRETAIALVAFVLTLLFAPNALLAQDAAPAKEKISFFNFNTKAIDAVNKQYSKLQSNVEKQSQKMLAKMQAKEDKLRRKLKGKDSTKAKELFNTDVEERYKNLQNKLTGKMDSSIKHPMQQYIPGLDSLQTALDFGLTPAPLLTQRDGLPIDKIEQVKALSGRIQQLQGRMQQASDIQSFIRERESSLKAQLQNTGLAKQLTSINKEVFYYQQRLSEYKNLLNDKDKLKDKLLSTVRSLPAFQKFWQKNSFIAQLFPMPGLTPALSPPEEGGLTALAGLQTRAGVSQQLTQRFGGGLTPPGEGEIGGGSSSYLQQQMQGAQSQLNTLKDKLSSKLGDLGGEGVNSDMTMPDFKPNEQHTKTFLQRLEYGFNVQSQKGSSFLPTTTDFALTVGYKLDDTKAIGMGVSYKMGWGSGFKDIQITNQGIGIRSYCDVKAKGSFWLSGGFEYNYLQSFSSLSSIYNNIDVWQRSALLGVTKKIKITPPSLWGKSKKTSESKIQFMYDFLHNEQNPPSNGFLFRVGWGF